MTEPETNKTRGIKRTILFRATKLAWLLIAFTLAAFVAAIIPYQKDIVAKRMLSEAWILATSLDHVAASAIVAEDYSVVVEHCLKVVGDTPSVQYIVLKRKDGMSLIHTPEGWRQVLPPGTPSASPLERPGGVFLESGLTGTQVYHYTYQLTYSGVMWGWVLVGLSLEQYHADLDTMYRRTAWLGGLALVAGFMASVLFTRRLTRPIRHLSHVTQRVAAGDLTAKAFVDSGDELQELAESFNRMTEHLAESQRKAEDSLKRQAELREKEILLREVHHRVKNNMQILSSLLRLQSRETDDRVAMERLQESQSRIRSMALIHEKLYRSQNLSEVDFHEYVRDLVSYLFRANGVKGNGIRLELNIPDVRFGIDTAIPCGLVINELVTNSLKYAFEPDQKDATIRVALQRTDTGEHCLIVADNGGGLPNPEDTGTVRTLGLRLVNILVNDQLNGTLKARNNNGTEFEVTFQETKYQARI